MATAAQSQPSTDLLRTVFGFTDFRLGQAEAIGSLLAGKQTLVVMPTGAGKSLVYQYAAVALPGTAVVISPLISLMQDQVESLSRRKVPATYINSSISVAEQNNRLDALAGGEYRLVYVAPERLRNLNFRNALLTTSISLLAVDEAHCISQWGHDFRPDYLQITDFRRSMGNPLTVALTATATPRVRDDISARLNLAPVNSIVTGFNRPNLTLRVISARNEEAKLRQIARAINGLKDGAAIIYVGTRRDSEEIADFVSETTGTAARFYHGGMSPEDRARTQNEFMSGAVSVVAATNAFGMGIDRSDVRMVIHHTIPSSLEEYYQEAGRAGRDGRPAVTALLYSPKDRSLQEYFIDNGRLTFDDLKSLHGKVGSRPQGVTSDEISLELGISEVAIRVGLAQLEMAGMLRITAREGLRWLVEAGPWNQEEAFAAVGRATAHLAARREQLERMVEYAESNRCRRRIILDHFADPGSAEAYRCCDNCLSTVQQISDSTPKQPAEENEVAHAVLDCVHRIDWGIGVYKLVQLLAGSGARSMDNKAYTASPHFGRLSGLRQEDIRALIDQLVELDYLKPIGGYRPVLKLSSRGETALKSRTSIPLTLHGRPLKAIGSASDCRPKEDTVEVTAQMIAEGMKPSEIAAKRGLNTSTIEGHLAHLIFDGRANLENWVTPEKAALITTAISRLGTVHHHLAPVKAALPENISYGEIKCVMAHLGMLPRGKPETGSRKTTNTTRTGAADAVSDYISRPHPKPLPGSWSCGWSLGFHSSFAGSDWTRSGVGQLAYQLKYQSDKAALGPLVREAMELIEKHPALGDVDAVVPVPPTTKRGFDPVSAFAEALAEELGVAVFPVVTKTRPTKPQKEMRNLAQKQANVSGAFAVGQDIRSGEFLLVDDLFDSGATLEEVHRTLKSAGARRVPVLTLTRTIHSDS